MNSKMELKLLNAVLNYVCENPVSLVIPKSDLSSLYVIGVLDVSFANSKHHTTQLGFLILVVGKFNCSVTIHFNPYGTPRIVRSLLWRDVFIQ